MDFEQWLLDFEKKKDLGILGYLTHFVVVFLFFSGQEFSFWSIVFTKEGIAPFFFLKDSPHIMQPNFYFKQWPVSASTRSHLTFHPLTPWKHKAEEVQKAPLCSITSITLLQFLYVSYMKLNKGCGVE